MERSAAPGRVQSPTPRLSFRLGLAAIAVCLVAAIPLGANRPVAWLVLFFVVFVLFCAELLFARSRPAGLGALALPAVLAVAVILWALAQSLLPLPPSLAHPAWALVGRDPAPISADPIAGLHMVLRMATFVMAFWLAAAAAARPAQAMTALMLIAAGVTLNAAFGLVAWLIDWNPVTGAQRMRVVTGSFVNRNHFATFAAFGLLANLCLYLHRAAPSEGSRRRVRDALERFFAGAWIYWLGAMICLGAILLSQSRGGAVATVAGALAVTGLSARRRPGRGGILATGALVAVLLLALSSSTLTRLVQTTADDGRWSIYPKVVEGISQRPALGHGAGAFHDTFRALKPAELATVEVDYAHSTYLEMAYELGLPAAAAWFAALGLVGFGVARGALTRRRHLTVPIFATACIVTAAVHAAVDFSLQIPAVAALFATILGLGWAQAHRPPSGSGEWRDTPADGRT